MLEDARVPEAHHFWVGLWDILHFPLLGLRGSYLLIFFKCFKSATWIFVISYSCLLCYCFIPIVISSFSCYCLLCCYFISVVIVIVMVIVTVS